MYFLYKLLCRVPGGQGMQVFVGSSVLLLVGECFFFPLLRFATDILNSRQRASRL